MDAVGAALERPAAERLAFLVDACGGDAALLAEARGLVAEAGQTSFAAVTAGLEGAVERAATDAVVDAERHPDRIGPFEIVRPLGRGGMGVVYLGRQEEPLRREVAIKVVRSALADHETLIRFHAERQALARMQHEGIARVFDAGTTEGGMPYFVMELVQGRPITEYCDERGLGLDERLSLFRTVCEAVHHAHQRGIIHRDLKPSNVLVAEDGGRSVAKVIDFGIAKAIEGGLGAESVHTRVGSVVGTVGYMSPEQVTGGGADVDVRSDVYSLGVILYELVTGRHPLDDTALRRAGLLEAQRIVVESDPPRPSWTLDHPRDGAKGIGPRIARDRTLRRRVREDLDWVVMKALEKDRERRYQSALELVQDLERYAIDEPVSAGPPSVAYVARKFVRRHRVGVTAASLALLALATGAGLAATGFVRATAEARRAEAMSAFLTDMLASVRPDQLGREVTVREVLDDARAQLEAGEFEDDPETAASLALVVGHSYEGLGRFDDALALMRRSVELRRGIHAQDDARVQASLYRVATVLWKQGELEEALAIRLDLAEVAERKLGSAHPDYAEALSNLGNTYADMGEFDRAVEYLDEAVAVGRRVPGDEGERNLARFLNNLGTVYFDQQDFERAEGVFREALEIRARLLGEESDVYAITLMNLGNAQLNQGDLVAAESTHRRAVELEERIFGEEHPSTAYAYSGLAEALLQQGRAEEAEPLVRRALAIREATTGSSYWRVSIERTKLAEVHLALGRVTEAERELVTAWEGLTTAGELGHPRALRVAEAMGRVQAALGDDVAARRWAALAGPT
jgi:non-specific serine/threonine protein kinase/serine/threonine-protein kinase